MSKYSKGAYHYADFAHPSAYRSHILDVVNAMRKPLLERKTRATILDIGCGEGLFMTLMAVLGQNVIGVEPDPKARAMAKLHGFRVEAGLDGVEISDSAKYHGDFIITMLDVLEHVEDLGATIKWAADRCSTIYVAVPDREDPNAVRQYCSQEVSRLFVSHGLTEEFVYTRHARNFMLFRNHNPVNTNATGSVAIA